MHQPLPPDDPPAPPPPDAPTDAPTDAPPAGPPTDPAAYGERFGERPIPRGCHPLVFGLVLGTLQFAATVYFMRSC